MTDSILPIDPSTIEEEPQVNSKEVKEDDKPLSDIEEDEGVEDEPEEEPKKKTPIFDKPPEISKRTGKPKRKLTEAQKENLAKARAKSLARRKELKEARAIDREKKKIERRKKQDNVIIKQEEQEALIAMKAKLQLEAEKAAQPWSEERLVGLIEKSIDNYIDKKKKAKPQPKVHIPAKQAYPQYSPQVAPQQYVNPALYMAPNMNGQPSQNPQGQQQQYNPNANGANNVMSTLFGNFNS